VALSVDTKAVNLGCGTSVAPGWINLDNSPNARLSKYPWLRWCLWRLRLLSDNHYNVPWPKSIVIHDLRRKLPFQDATIDFVYASHVLEHLRQDDAQKLIQDVYRVLRPGGLTRIVVPDLAFGAQRYLDALQADPGNSQAASDFLNSLQLREPGHRNPHLWMYDTPSLKSLLTEVGFIHVAVCKHKHGRVPDSDILDNRPEGSLHMEAEKP
jgi:predicted SAM-dependent methyltransferase